MVDSVDSSNDKSQDELDNIIATARSKALDIPTGNPGECDLCGHWSGRLVLGACAPCRDRWKLA